MREEIFSYVQCWLPSAPAREQVQCQNEAEKYFDWCCEQMKQEDVEISPIKRSMMMLEDENGHVYMVRYFQRARVKATEEILRQLKYKCHEPYA